MMKRLFLAIVVLAATLAPVSTYDVPMLAAQTIDMSKFPAQAAGEYGPQVAVEDSLSVAGIVTGDGTNTHTTGEGAPDNVGAFRFICNPGQNNAHDPLVAFNIFAGAPHTHQWYGNKGGNHASTYATLRTTGETTCAGKGNRTAYWLPDMRSGGKVRRPEYVVIYYKRYPKGSPQCTPGDPSFAGECVGLPNNLRMIFGYDFLTNTAPTGSRSYKCVKDSSNRSDSLADMVAAASYCQIGDLFVTIIHAPGCWDGVNLDSANHRNHVSYANPHTGKCPSTHPKHIPDFSAQTAYLVDGNLDRSGTWAPGKPTWYFSCDRMPGMTDMRPGTCVHQDYFEAWNPRIKKAWTDNCIDRLLNCSGGDLGNGYVMKPDEAVTYVASPRDVAVPLVRGGTAHGTVHVGHH